jgi:glycosyltransferase involved in cell wall biosynthesis
VINIKPVVSIIVPVYNVERYLHRCIDSILAQTFSNFELILINDGSTDKSGTICDYYANKDKRVKVVHMTNGGVSKARNMGLELAQGDYLMFCDSDDYVEANWCNDLYLTIKHGRKVLPVIGVRVVNAIGDGKKESIKAFQQKMVLKNNRYFELYKIGLSASLWCKIYDRKIVEDNSVYFDINVNRGEDLLFNLSYILHVDSIISIPTIGYNYIHSNENSLFNGYRKDLSEINVMVYYAWKEYFNKLNVEKEQLEEFATYFYLNFLNMLKYTFDQRNKDNLIKKIRLNNYILNSKEFNECLNLADTSKEDLRYIKLLKTNNYYLVWVAEQVIKIKNILKVKNFFGLDKR